jgi:hypothetical protein
MNTHIDILKFFAFLYKIDQRIKKEQNKLKNIENDKSKSRNTR